MIVIRKDGKTEWDYTFSYGEEENLEEKNNPIGVDVYANDTFCYTIPIGVSIKIGDTYLYTTGCEEGEILIDLDISWFLRPSRVIFNGTTTKCYFRDGTEEKVELMSGDTYDRQKGLALCIAKRIMGGWTGFEDAIENAEYYGGAKKE